MVDQIAAGQPQLGEGRLPKALSDPTLEGGPPGNRLPAFRGQPFSAQVATTATVLAEGVANGRGELHDSSIPRG